MADEELKLSVKLDDQASAALAALQAQLQNLSNAAAQATTSFQNLPTAQQRQTRQNAQVARETSQEMGRMAYAIGFIGGAVGGAVSELTRMGIAFVQRATDVKAYSQEIVNLNAKAYTMGTSTAQLKANIEALGEVGIPKDEALQQLETFNRRRSDLMIEGGAASREFLKGDEDGKLMDLRNRLIEAKEEDAYKIAIDFAKKEYDLTIERGHGRVRAAAVLRANLERLGIDPRAANAVVRQVSKEEEEFQDRRTKDADRYTRAINQQQGSLGKILDTMMAIGLAVGGVSEGTEGITVWTNAVLKDLKSWETVLRDTKDQSIQGLIDATIIWGRTTDTWVGQQIGKFAADVKMITADIKALYQFMKAEHDDVINRLNRKQGPEAKSGLEWIQDYVAGRVDFSGNPIPLGAQPKAIESFEQGEQGRAGRPGAPVAPPPPLIEEKPPAATIIHPGRGAALPVPPTVETVGQGQTAPDSGIVLRQAQPREETPATEPKRTLLDDISRAWDWLRGRNLGATAPQQFTTGATVGPTVGKFVPDPEFLAGHESVMIEDRRAIEAQTTATKASTEEMQNLRAAFAALGPKEVTTETVEREEVPQEAPAPMIVPQETAAPVIVQQEAPAPTIVQPEPEQIILPQALPWGAGKPGGLEALRNLIFGGGTQEAAPAPIVTPQPVPFDERFGNWQQQQSQLPSAFEGGVPIDLAGTAGAAQASGSWMQASMEDCSRDVNVNGTGSISVDVRAPQGTNVKADSGGLFRKTEISRQVQMEPAEFGLMPTMG